MLNYAVEGSVATPGVIVENQLIDWRFDEEIDVTRSDYLISVPSARLRGDEQTRWRFPDIGHRYRARMFGMVPPGIPIKCSRRPGQVRVLSCRIDRDHFARSTGIEACHPDQLIAILNVDHPVFRTLFAQMASEVTHPGFAAPEYVSSLSTLMLIEIARRLKAADGDGGIDGALADWQLRKLREAIHDAPPVSRLTVQGLAAHVGLSSRHLMRGFKAATGLTLHTYIEQVRLERTKGLLQTDAMPLKAIADAMGFANASHLSAAFRKSTGMSPSAWRAAARAGLFR